LQSNVDEWLNLAKQSGVNLAERYSFSIEFKKA
jgi:hypothetical protein